ncbi:MAG: O-antigen ligase family protein [Patescibacteria group bacterium]|nr:O-antigen ligase family protein [Patescibacteria group bacterium]
MQIKKYFNLTAIFFLLELLMIVLMAIDILPLEMRYFLFFILIISFLVLSFTEALILFIISIPLFTALPIDGISDSFSSWRILVIILALRLLFKQKRSAFILTKQTLEEKMIAFKKLSFYKLFLFFLVFIFINLASLLVAKNIGAGIKEIIFLLNIALLFPIIITVIKNEKQLLRIIKAVFFAGVITVLIGFIQLFTTFIVPLHIFWHFWDQRVISVFYGQNLSALLSYSNTWFSYYDNLPPTLRMFSVMPDSHSFALFVLFVMPFTLFLIIFYSSQNLSSKYPLLKILTLFLTLSFSAIIFSGSRGIWLSSFFGLITGIYLLNPYKFYKLKPRFQKIKLTASARQSGKLILFSVFIFFFVIPASSFILKQNQFTQISWSENKINQQNDSAFFERASSIYDFSEASNKGRMEIWLATIDSISARPFLGVGVGNFPLILEQNCVVSKIGSSAHNLYFEIAAEIGLFGLIIFLFILREILQKSYWLFGNLKSQPAKIFAGSFFVYAVWIFGYGLFDVVLFNDKVLLLSVISIGIIYSLKKIEYK